MRKEYIECTIDDLGTIGRGKSKHRPRNDPSLFGGNYPFIQTGDVKHANFYITKFSETYNDKGLAQSKLWPVGTLCITIAANIAETAILSFPACFPDSIIGFLPDQNKSDLKFVKYCLEAYKLQIQSISHGTTQDNLSLEKLKTIKFKVPPLPTQKKIAAVLSAYDDLIENNTRRIALLEGMAEELYKEWFVRMRFPGHESARFEKGIPEGWEVKRLREILELAYGKALKSDDRIEGDFPVYGSSGIVGYHNAFLVKGPGIIVGRKGNVGSVIWSSTNFYPIDTVFYVKSDIPLRFLYYLLQTVPFINSDAAVPGLNRNQAYSIPVFIPETDLIYKFTKTVNPMLDMALSLEKSNQNLKTTRDRLLTRLISGKLSVEELDIAFPPSMQDEQPSNPEQLRLPLESAVNA